MAIATLLFCQAVWDTHGQQIVGAGMATGVVSAGCHSSMGDELQQAAPTPCDSAQAPSDDFKVAAISLVALQLSAVLPFEPRRHAQVGPVSFAPLAGAPPPLHLLHCRLLN